MVCHICKDKVATIRLKEIVNNVVTELHLCQACFEAREKEGKAGFSSSVDKALDSIVSAGKKQAKKRTSPQKCDTCGITEEQFLGKGRMGCGDCYKAFATSLLPLVSKIHGSTAHRGKAPHEVARKLDVKNELTRLQEDLQRAILSENYERAAKLRDKIRMFESM
jgi:protein arginine kinase activator